MTQQPPKPLCWVTASDSERPESIINPNPNPSLTLNLHPALSCK
uniref:Uncharacterized protein n=1 Tax=Anguilla anguilla TaxID=7936 RepID=A0A0E9RCL8_ANGAN